MTFASWLHNAKPRLNAVWRVAAETKAEWLCCFMAVFFFPLLRSVNDTSCARGTWTRLNDYWTISPDSSVECGSSFILLKWDQNVKSTSEKHMSCHCVTLWADYSHSLLSPTWRPLFIFCFVGVSKYFTALWTKKDKSVMKPFIIVRYDHIHSDAGKVYILYINI